MIAFVAEKAPAWPLVPHAVKLELLEEMRDILNDVTQPVGDAASQLRGFMGTVREVSLSVVCAECRKALCAQPSVARARAT